jgi:hypothetical protein
MKTKIVALTLSLTLLVSAGCASVSQWWQNFTKNPIAQIQSFEQEVATILTILNTAWQFIQPFIPAAVLPFAQTQYTNAVAAVGHAEAALQDGVTAAVDATQSPMPDFSGLVTAVTAAVNQVIAIVDQYKGTAPVAVPDAGPTIVAATSPVGLEEARARNAKLKTFKIQVK